MRKLLLAAIVAGAPLGAAHAVPTSPFAGTLAVSGTSDVTATGTGSFSDAVNTNNTLSGPFNLFTLNPGGSCSGPHCSGNTVTETLTVSLTGLTFQGYNLAPITLTGTYMAKYSGSELACAVGDGVSPSSGETDCFLWTGATSADYKGTLTVNEAFGTAGAKLALTFQNATDWSITPTVTIVDPPAPAPEPASLAIFGVGLFGLGFFGLGFLRRKKG